MGQAQKILVGESDIASSMELHRRLRSHGFDVVAANDAIHVMKVAREEQPDAIVLSARLAGGGALAALKRIRSNVFTTNIPVIGLLADVGTPANEMLSAGAQACVPPRSEESALIRAIEQHVLQSLDFTQAPQYAIADPERLAAVEDTQLLDTPPEASFDRLTRMGARLLGVPVAIVSVVDRDRQFIKSQHGLGEPLATERKVRFSHSFCQWVVSGHEALVIGDAREHPVLSRNLAVRDFGVIAYAGVPLEGRGGQAIGTFCAIDTAPRAWSAEDVATLEDLATLAEAYGELERARRSGGSGAAENKERLLVSLHVAGNAVLGVTNLLKRYGIRLSSGEREELLAILREQSEHLVKLAAA